MGISHSAKGRAILKPAFVHGGPDVAAQHPGVAGATIAAELIVSSAWPSLD